VGLGTVRMQRGRWSRSRSHLVLEAATNRCLRVSASVGGRSEGQIRHPCRPEGACAPAHAALAWHASDTTGVLPWPP
jgi:hypothetical protein